MVAGSRDRIPRELSSEENDDEYTCHDVCDIGLAILEGYFGEEGPKLHSKKLEGRIIVLNQTINRRATYQIWYVLTQKSTTYMCP